MQRYELFLIIGRGPQSLFMLIDLSYNLCFLVLSFAAPSSVATRHTENKFSSALAALKMKKITFHALLLTLAIFFNQRCDFNIGILWFQHRYFVTSKYLCCPFIIAMLSHERRSGGRLCERRGGRDDRGLPHGSVCTNPSAFSHSHWHSRPTVVSTLLS